MTVLERPASYTLPAQAELQIIQRLPKAAVTLPLIVAAVYGLVSLSKKIPHPWLFAEARPDDLARLAQVRDFLQGQGWFDLIQARLDPPEGVWMHWSRFVDAPIAGLYWLGDLMGAGEEVALFVWPFLLFLAFFAILGIVTRELVGENGVLFAMMAAPLFHGVNQAFNSGRIDHHNLQIVLCGALLIAVLRFAHGSRAGAAAGVIAALMVGIGLETLPVVAAAGLAAAVYWVKDPRRYFSAVVAFGAAFATAMALVFGLSVPSARFALDQCDSISRFHLAMGLTAGFGLSAIVLLVPASASVFRRLGGLTLLGAICFGVAVTWFPQCLGDPYAGLDPRLRQIWLDNVSEARNALRLLSDEPFIFAISFVPLALMSAILIHIMRIETGPAKEKWMVFALLAAVSIVIALIQVRFVQFAQVYCIPVIAWVMSRVYGAIVRTGPSVSRFLILIAIPICLSPWLVVIPKYLFSTLETPKTSSVVARQHGEIENPAVRECQAPVDRAALGAISPPGSVATPVFFGSAILGFSDLPVLAGPYHRAQSAILDSYDIFSGSPQEAEKIIRRRNVRYVIFCVSTQNRMVDGDRYPDSLTARLERQELPAWLEKLPNEGSGFLRIYRVRS